jgi:ribosomal protein S18 acetylase RimI-like enzyme
MAAHNACSAAEIADARAVQAYLRSRARNGPRSGPFSALLSPGSRNPYGNYAIPDDDAEPSPVEILALEDLFRTRDRVPRLEFVPAASPHVEPALVAAGFVVEARPPFMTCRRDTPTSVRPLAGTEFCLAVEADRLQESVSVEAKALAGEEADSAWLASLPERGGKVLIACEQGCGKAVAVGALTRQIDGIAEIVAIGVVPEFRRRGIGQAITSALANLAFDDGCTLTFLSAAGEAQAEIYARAGFVRRSPMLFISKPQT